MLGNTTIAGIATPPGEGGIGIIRLSGNQSFSIGNALFKGKNGRYLEECEERKLNYGYIVDPEKDMIIDEVMVVFMKGPGTYTKEDIVEIHCHGGVVSVGRILDLVIDSGASLAERGEFTKRAFLNGRIDLSQAEAIIDLIKAKTDSGFDVSINHLKGNISTKIKELQDKLMEILTHIEVSIDFPEEDIEEISLENIRIKSKEIKDEIEKLLKYSETGRILKEGVKTVIVGKPNVGKSSLMNSLLRESRAIVTNIPGTTRDTIEEFVNIKGVPVRIVDTAGIRDTDDIVEKIGVDRAREYLMDSDLVIAVFDISRKLEEDDIEIIEKLKNRKAIVVLNKMDLKQKIEYDYIMKKIEDTEIKVIETAIIEEKGLEDLENEIKSMFFENKIKIEEDVIVTNSRQKGLLMDAKRDIEEGISSLEGGLPIDYIEVDIKRCWENLGRVTGNSIGEDVIDEIFKNFCIGK